MYFYDIFWLNEPLSPPCSCKLKKVMVIGGKKKCKICEVADSNYKCPSCLIPYCSLPSFKKHKAPNPQVERSCFVDEPSVVLQQSQLEPIPSSSEILDALKNEELRKLIYNVDSSADAESEFDKALAMDVFRLY